MKWFRDRKTVVLCCIIVVLASTNLYTLWSDRRATNASKNLSASLNLLPLEVACRPVADAANAEVLTVHCSLANPTKDDLQRTTLSLKDVTNAILVEANFAPKLNPDGSLEWDVGVLPAMQKFEVFVTMRRTSAQPISAWLTGKSDGSPIVTTPLVETLN